MKKPAFTVVLPAAITCIALVLVLLANPTAKREFPMNGSNVSQLSAEQNQCDEVGMAEVSVHR